MKKIVALGLAVGILLCICSCEGETEVVSSDLPSAVTTPTPDPTESPEPTETPTPTETPSAESVLPTPRPDGLYNVESLTAEISLNKRDGEVLVYDKALGLALRYDKDKAGFSVVYQARPGMSGGISVYGPDYFRVSIGQGHKKYYVKKDGGQVEEDDPYEEMGTKWSFYEEDGGYFLVEGTAFKKTEFKGYPWYEYPKSLAENVEISKKNRPLNDVCVFAYWYSKSEEGDTTFPPCQVFAYNYATGKQSPILPFNNNLIWDLSHWFTYLAGNYMAIDYERVDVSKMFDENYQTVTLGSEFRDGSVYTAHYYNGTTYFASENRVYAFTADGKSRVVYHQQGDLPISQLLLTETGKFAILTQKESPPGEEREPGAVYVDGEKLCDKATHMYFVTEGCAVTSCWKDGIYVNNTKVSEEGETFVYADENNLIVRKPDGTLRLIPLT